MKPTGRRIKNRYFMSQKQMREARWYQAVINSREKRLGVKREYPLYQCGCGCGVA